MIPDRATYKKIEWHFYHYENLKEEVERIREEILQRANYAQDLSGVRGMRQGSPTERQALALERELAEKTAWVQVVEETVRHFQGTPLYELYKMRYERKLKNYQISDSLFISITTCKEWKRNIVYYACCKAIEKRLIKI